MFEIPLNFRARGCKRKYYKITLMYRVDEQRKSVAESLSNIVIKIKMPPYKINTKK